MNLLKACVLLAALAPGRAAWAQRPLGQQFAGATVLLTSGDTLRGPVTLYTERDVLLLRQPDHSVLTVAAGAVAAFSVHGELARPGDFVEQAQQVPAPPPGPGEARQPTLLAAPAGATRVFRALPWNHGDEYADYRSPAFFEQLSAGPVQLLRRQQLLERPVAAAELLTAGAAPMGSLGRGPVGYFITARSRFFLATPAGEVIALRCPRRQLLAYFRAEAGQIEQYARQEFLSFQTSEDLARIVTYANSLRWPK